MARRGGRGGGRGPSRAQVRERELAAAASVVVDGRYDVVVMGGGASGLAAAVAAGERGARVLVLEADRTCGRTILATGNGRCNFSNVGLAPKYYNDPGFVGAVFGEDPLRDVLDFFRGCDMRWCLEGERLYPLSRRAASVRNVLLRRARGAATLAPARAATGISRDGRGFRVTYRELWDGGADRTVAAANVVVATGGPRGGSDGERRGDVAPRLDVAGDLGLRTVPASPALCPVACEDSPLLALDGRRLHVRAQLTHGTFPMWSERGEALLRPYGISGIVVFDMSRRVRPGDLVELDLVPDMARSELQQMVDPFLRGGFEPGCLDGVLDPDVAAVLERLARERWLPEGFEREPAGTDSEALVGLAKAYPLRTTGVAEPERAQVTRGGLACDQFDPKTLGCRGVPGLHACGEALDVDGDCGGFNLSWAWKSGLVAGGAAASR